MGQALAARRGTSLALAAGLVLLIGLAAWLLLARSSQGSPGADPSRLSQTALEQGSGVRVVRLATTAAGGLVDLRWQVIDPEKALAVHDYTPTIIDEKSGRAVNQPFMGHVPHSIKLQAGQTYYMIFFNPGDVIKPGSRVTVVLGRARLEHVAVQ